MTDRTTPDANRSTPTPGPWELSEPGSLLVVTPLRKGKEAIIAGCWGHVPETEWPLEGMANARLIASAPDLLAALEALYEAWDVDAMDRAMKMAEAAIARATGTEASDAAAE